MAGKIRFLFEKDWLSQAEVLVIANASKIFQPLMVEIFQPLELRNSQARCL